MPNTCTVTLSSSVLYRRRIPLFYGQRDQLRGVKDSIRGVWDLRDEYYCLSPNLGVGNQRRCRHRHQSLGDQTSALFLIVACMWLGCVATMGFLELHPHIKGAHSVLAAQTSLQSRAWFGPRVRPQAGTHLLWPGHRGSISWGPLSQGCHVAPLPGQCTACWLVRA